MTADADEAPPSPPNGSPTPRFHCPPRTWQLLDSAGVPYVSSVPGTFGGHRRSKIYGRLDCRSAQQWLARGHYARHRVFFADEPVARAAGYRPCAVCMPAEYEQWTVGR